MCRSFLCAYLSMTSLINNGIAIISLSRFVKEIQSFLFTISIFWQGPFLFFFVPFCLFRFEAMIAGDDPHVPRKSLPSKKKTRPAIR